MATPPRRRPRRAVTGRALVLGTLVILLLVVLASPLNRYFQSRSALNDAAQKLKDDKARVTQLTKQLGRWGDPGYIQQQARQRLQYAMPGDSVYVVVDHGQRNDIAKTSGRDTHRFDQAGWNARLWNSVTSADSDK
ncbi:MAG TPA: septum formation initiator family protein [Jatrophihabitans sp.]|jgi:cell division protein FtsB